MAGSYASELATLTFGDGLQVAVAVHGITASAMAWSVAARAMPREWTLVAPDLGGAGQRRPARSVRTRPAHRRYLHARPLPRREGRAGRPLDGRLRRAAGRGGAPRAIQPADPHRWRPVDAAASRPGSGHGARRDAWSGDRTIAPDLRLRRGIPRSVQEPPGAGGDVTSTTTTRSRSDQGDGDGPVIRAEVRRCVGSQFGSQSAAPGSWANRIAWSDGWA
jgi:hypothetical protein